ncbi:tetratricopeptide repeat protein [Rhodobacterales bacterium HKCCE2091]|nr:tetratricopeptide repeat protein [Rhodobacterales bacterium HKCCE2091]
MKALPSILNLVVAAVFGLCAGGAWAQADDRLGELLDRLGDPDTLNWEIVEQEIIQRWSISGSASADLMFTLGVEAMEAGELEDAIAYLTAVVDQAPEFAEGWNARATAYYRAGLAGPALYDLQEVLARNPQHFGALIGLGIILEDMGESDTALDAFRAAQAIHPHRPDVEGAIVRIERDLEGRAL